MVIRSTIRKKNEKGRWTFVVNAALRAPSGMAIVIEGLNPKDLHSAAECVRHRKAFNLVAIEWRGLLIAYKPTEDFWEYKEAGLYARQSSFVGEEK